MFGGDWTQQKLKILSKYLSAYRRIFSKNERARYFQVSYVDAFAGTGVIPRPPIEGTFAEFLPSLEEAESEFRKGSVRRALEVQPPFHHYVFIETDRAKCEELSRLRGEFPTESIEIIEDDANEALLKWCRAMDRKRQRAVVFLDPFGASVDWKVIEELAGTGAIDLWILFPYSAVNRMLIRDRKPSPSWSEKLTRIFGTPAWFEEFYSSSQAPSILEPDQRIERTFKTADRNVIVAFFEERLHTIFSEVPKPGLLFNSRNLLFVFYFGSSNKTGAKIANDLLRKIVQ
jgi:three-Cys-motif partner protein